MTAAKAAVILLYGDRLDYCSMAQAVSMKPDDTG